MLTLIQVIKESMSGAKFQIQFLFVLILLVSFSFCKERWNRRRRPINKMADPERLGKFVSGERLKEYQTLAREKRDVTNGYNQVNVTIKALFNYGCNIYMYIMYLCFDRCQFNWRRLPKF